MLINCREYDLPIITHSTHAFKKTKLPTLNIEKMKNKKIRVLMLSGVFILLSAFLYSFINLSSPETQTVPPGTNTPDGRFLVGAIGSYNRLNMHA